MNKRLQILETNVAELRKIKAEYSVADIRRDKTREWALRYGLLESIQIVIDIACHIVVHHNLGNTETYAGCLRLLEQFDVIDEQLADDLTGMAGLRNILVHEYVAVDVDRLYSMLDKLEGFTAFADAVSTHL